METREQAIGIIRRMLFQLYFPCSPILTAYQNRITALYNAPPPALPRNPQLNRQANKTATLYTHTHALMHSQTHPREPECLIILRICLLFTLHPSLSPRRRTITECSAHISVFVYLRLCAPSDHHMCAIICPADVCKCVRARVHHRTCSPCALSYSATTTPGWIRASARTARDQPAS